MMIGLALIALSFLMPDFIYGTELSGAGVYASCVGKAGEDRSDGGCFTPGDVKCPARLLRIISEHIILPSRWNSYRRGKKSWIPNACMILLILPLVYEGIGLVHGIPLRLWFAGSASGSSVVLFRRLDYQYISINQKEPDAADFYYSFSVPGHHAADERSARGDRGEMSSDIKLFADVLEANSLLNAIGCSGNFSCDPVCNDYSPAAAGMRIIFCVCRRKKKKCRPCRAVAALLEMKNRTYGK